MRKILKRIMPGHEAVNNNRWLRLFGTTLLHPALWHLSRRSAAGGVAAGLFCGLIPGPFQMIGAAIAAIIFRINLPLAIIATLFTNPLTIIPLYAVAFELGRWVTGNQGPGFTMPPEFIWGEFGTSVKALVEWGIHLGKPILIGLPLLATLLAAAGYIAVRLLWRFQVMGYLKRRKTRDPRTTQTPPPKED